MAKRKKNPTCIDVAKLAGVSHTTVSFVINNVPGIQISEETRKAVWKAVKELNYHPNSMAQGMRTKSSNTIGLVVHWAVTDFLFNQAVEGVQEAAYQNNYYTLLCHTKGEQQREGAYLRYFFEKRLDGIVFITSTTKQDYSNIEPIFKEKVPFVIVNCGVEDPRLPAIFIDNYQGARMAVIHHYQQGHRRIGIIGTGGLGGKALSDRCRGYQETMEELGLEPIFPLSYSLPGAFNDQKPRGLQQTEELLNLPKPPTAIYATSDLAMFGAFAVANRKGMTIPTDLALVGNDNYLTCEHLYPALSSVEQPLYKAGKEAVRILLEMLKEGNAKPQQLILHPKLIVRESSLMDEIR
jgi:LacI family transcriptional regulator